MLPLGIGRRPGRDSVRPAANALKRPADTPTSNRHEPQTTDRIPPQPAEPKVKSPKENASETLSAVSSNTDEAGRRAAGKSRILGALIPKLLKSAAMEWSQDKCPQLGAALAYYTIFSLAPLVVVLLGLFGLVYHNSEQARDKILELLRHLTDPSALKVIQDIANNAAQPKASTLATLIGISIAVFGASGIFGQLQDALNTIWKVKAKPNQGVWGFLRARFVSFAMVGGVCFLLLVSLTVQGLLHGLHAYLETILPGGQVLGLGIFYLFDFAVVALLFAMIFRCLPDVKIAWRDVWTGAILTAFFFLIGKFLLGLYLASGAGTSAYGAAGSLVTLLIWVFYSAQILLFGAEFTKVYANTHGSRFEPKEYAVKLETREIEVPTESPAPNADDQRQPQPVPAKPST
jgi:membrane protein